MTYAVSYALQAAVYDRLVNDSAVMSFVSGNVFDAPPNGVAPETYVLLGDEIARDRSTTTSAGAAHDFTINVVSDQAGFATAKQLAAAICDALVDAPLTLSRGMLVALNFRTARAVREDSPGIRQIDLRFRALVEDT
ncbi:MAG: DUF3168 domain-containing protein [Pseudomonadota bacterium]